MMSDCKHTIDTSVDYDGCCVSCGEDLNYLVCPKCNGTGEIHWTESDEEYAKPCECISKLSTEHNKRPTGRKEAKHG